MKCSISTVTRTTSLLEKLGWLIKIRKPYCSNVYYLNDEIISLNLDDESINLRPKCSVNDHVLESSSSDSIDIHSTKDQVYPHEEEKKNNPIPKCIKIAGLTPKEQQDLANKYSESDLVNAIAAAKWYIREGNTIKSLVKYLWTAAKNRWYGERCYNSRKC